MHAPEPGPYGPGNPERPTHRYLFLRFLRYGVLAWGGPVAQIGLMHREVVERDAWIDENRFRKTLALYQALPGPEAMELAVYFGVLKRGRLGGFLTGLGFMLPGVLLVASAAALYLRFAPGTATVDLLLYGVRPAVVALIAAGVLRLLRVGVTQVDHVLVAAGAFVATLAEPRLSFLLLVAVGGLVALAVAHATRDPTPGLAHALVPLVATAFPALSVAGLGALAVLSAKVGLLTFGGAYTAIPILHEGAVEEHQWLTEGEFLDAVAVSGMLPGPLIAVGTFVGYQVAGVAGAALATVLIFAPAFAFTLLGHGYFERAMNEPRLHALLLGVTAVMVGLIAATLVPLAGAAIVDPQTGLLAALALACLATRLLPIPIVILGSAAGGLVLQQWFP